MGDGTTMGILGKLRIVAVPAVALVMAALVGPAAARGQIACMVTNTYTLGPQMIGKAIHFTITAGTFRVGCRTQTSVNANCAGGTSNTFLAAAMDSNVLAVNGNGTGMSPFCSWRCGRSFTGATTTCATVTLDSSDGLPVELLDFSIAKEGAASQPPARSEEGEQPES